jgi:NADH-quinone oxidoreductase subunit N
VAGGRDGFSAALFYTTTYAITLVGAFGVVGFVRCETGGDDLSNFSGLCSRSPLMAGCMAIFMLSLAGIPPLAGFFGKFYLFSAALHASPTHGLLWLVALGLFGSFISLYYYLMVLKFIFVNKQAEAGADHRLVRRSLGGGGSLITDHVLQKSAISLLAAAVLLLGVIPDILASQILEAIQ